MGERFILAPSHRNHVEFESAQRMLSRLSSPAVDLRFDLDSAHRRVVVELPPRATVDDWVRAVAQLILDDAWSYGIVFLVQAGHNASLYLNLPNLAQTVRELVVEHGDGPAMVFVVDAGWVGRWRTQLRVSFEHVLPIDACTTLEAARTWLDAHAMGDTPQP